jgi:hypothetical protein
VKDAPIQIESSKGESSGSGSDSDARKKAMRAIAVTDLTFEFGASTVTKG